MYVSKNSYDPLTQPLGWGDLDLVSETGPYAPGAGRTSDLPALTGVSVDVPVSAPDKTGRSVIFTIWKASHSDQTYYLCSDVEFGAESDGIGPAPITGAPDVTTLADPATLEAANPTPASTTGDAGTGIGPPIASADQQVTAERTGTELASPVQVVDSAAAGQAGPTDPFGASPEQDSQGHSPVTLIAMLIVGIAVGLGAVWAIHLFRDRLAPVPHSPY